MARAAALVFCFSLLSGEASMACDPKPDWRPPTPATAFGRAEVVVHAKVLSAVTDSTGAITEGRVTVLKVLKGKFTGNMVATGASSLCGIGRLPVGQEYVFFFNRRGSWWVDSLSQPPRLSAAEVLADISRLPHDGKAAPGELVPTDRWDLPPYESPMRTMEILREAERSYQESLKSGR